MKKLDLFWLLYTFFLMLFIPSFGQAPSDRYKDIIIDPNYKHTKWGVQPSDMVYTFAVYVSSFDSDDDNAADRTIVEAGYNTHSTLNAVPQLQWQDNGIWKDLEEDVEKWADQEGSV